MTEIESLPGRQATGTMARRLARHLEQAHRVALKHSQAVDAIAAALGFRNRHELSDAQNQPQDAAQPGRTVGARLNAHQRLVLIYYAGGDHADLADHPAVDACGDPLLIQLVRLLDGVADAAAAKSRLDRTGDLLGDLRRPPLDNPRAGLSLDKAERTLVEENARGRTRSADGFDVGDIVRGILDAAAADTPNGRALWDRLAIADLEIGSLYARVRDRDEHLNRFGACGHALGQRLCEPHANIDRFAVFITQAGRHENTVYTVHLPDGTAVEMPYTGRDPRWVNSDPQAVADRIARGDLQRLTTANLTRHFLGELERELNPRYADWFTTTERWTLSHAETLARLQAWADRVRPSLTTEPEAPLGSETRSEPVMGPEPEMGPEPSTDLPDPDTLTLDQAREIFGEFDRPGPEATWYAPVGGDSLDLVRLTKEGERYYVGVIRETLGGCYSETEGLSFDDAVLEAARLLVREWREHPIDD